MARNTAPRDYWFVTRELTVSAFMLRDQGTLLGFFWTPLAMLSVLYWLFRTPMRRWRDGSTTSASTC